MLPVTIYIKAKTRKILLPLLNKEKDLTFCFIKAKKKILLPVLYKS